MYSHFLPLLKAFHLYLSFALIIFSSLALSQQETLSTVVENSTQEFVLPKMMKTNLLNDMVLVEAGTFEMGSNTVEARNREKPVHKVTLDSYYLSRFEVTQQLFLQIMGWNNSYFQCETCPVNNISWFNMQLFIERLNLATGKNFRFPTEAEWEFAAKGGNKSKGYSYAGSNNINDVAWYAGNAMNKSHPVGQKKPNELGLYDMTGNLWEFCLDDLSRHAYTDAPRINPVILIDKDPTKKSMKVLRGSGYEFDAKESLVFLRDGATNNVRMPDIGLRLAMSTDNEK